MYYDVFFSLSRTPAGGVLPSEAQMFANFFEQVELADALGFGTAWVAESHLSSEVQKQNRAPVIPHWKGEVGLNTDILQLAARVFQRTKRIEVGSAISNILCMGGPIAHAERLATFLTLHGLSPSERRQLHFGFASGRFDFMNAASGIVPRTRLEELTWNALKGVILREAAEIFLRLLKGESLSSDDIPQPLLSRESFRKDDDWRAAQEHWLASQAPSAGAAAPESLPIERRWVFEKLKLVPEDYRRDLLELVLGSHDSALQDYVNSFLPVKLFNLSITRPEVIEATHQRMQERYHAEGGAWQRQYMPRTVFVFLNDEPDSTPEECARAARKEAEAALGAYWDALEGTIDPARVKKAADNALVGNLQEVTEQILARFHPQDRLMLWFDFFNHDSTRVMRNMEAFMKRVVPEVEARLRGKA